MSREMIGTLTSTKVQEKSIKHSINYVDHINNDSLILPDDTYTLRSRHCNTTKTTMLVECSWSDICCTMINDPKSYQYLMLEI